MRRHLEPRGRSLHVLAVEGHLDGNVRDRPAEDPQDLVAVVAPVAQLEVGTLPILPRPHTTHYHPLQAEPIARLASFGRELRRWNLLPPETPRATPCANFSSLLGWAPALLLLGLRERWSSRAS